MRAKRSVFVVAVIAALALFVQLSPPASARWAYGDGPSDVDITFEASSTSNEVCGNHIWGRVGISDVGDPATFVAPPGPYGTRTVQLYASDVSLLGATVEAGGLRRTDGVLVPPLLVQTTGELQPLNPFETYDGGGGTNIVYAAAPFNFVPAEGAVPAGTYLAVKMASRSAFAQARAIDCAPYVPPTVATTTPADLPTTTTTTTPASVTTTTSGTDTPSIPETTIPDVEPVPEETTAPPVPAAPAVYGSNVIPAGAAVPIYGTSTFTG